MAQTKAKKSLAAKRARLWLLYRITPEEQGTVEAYQRRGRFSILLTKGNPNAEARLYNDHEHSSGLYRGRLAYLINKALGTIENTYKKRTPEVLRALADYLENPPAVDSIGPHYGLLGKAKRKKKMLYGPPTQVPKKGNQ